MLMGIFASALCALLQSLSYISSAAFLKRYNSSFSLLVFSQLAMGIVSIPVAIIFFPRGLFNNIPQLSLYLLIWLTVICAGQYFFFATQKYIEPSRLSSFLGLKIIVIAVLTMIFFAGKISLLQGAAILLATAAAVVMNGGKATRKMTWKAVFLLAATVINYCLADLTETKLMKLSESGNIWCDGLGVCATCYMILGFAMLPLLKKCKFSFEKLKYGSPYGVLYFGSQVALFVSFGLIGPVFANVIQSSRGIISVLLGVLLSSCKFGSLDVKGDKKLWLRRFACAIIMTAAIILYACFPQK